MTLHWPAEAIWQAVAPALPGFTVEVLPEIDSTNSELMRRARRGQMDPVLLVAEVQTAGRGRLGRPWYSASVAAAAGLSLTFSLGLALPMADWSGLSLAVGVCLAQRLHAQVQLKWPNDLWLQDRKLGGILIETASVEGSAAPALRYGVIGVGLNIGPRETAGLSTPPACLQELLPDVQASDVLWLVVPPLVAMLQSFPQQGLAPWQAGFAQRDALQGRSIVLSDGSAGQARGIDARGALLVHTAGGLRAVDSGEVSVRPAPAAGAI